ncbi:class I SAM-dependent methyltransferase [Gammaproteobacteria bacterium]|nr:class I SAM-dependent methyltransferase [Gammaproteobacteria bacterium]
MDINSEKEKFEEYYEYLRSGSILGKIYRRWFLYPKVNLVLEGKILDVGCGIGHFLRSRPEALGIDINPRTVAFCQSQGLNAKHVEGFPSNLASESFDSILLDNVIEHIEDPSDLLKEVQRLLKKDGVFVVGIPGEKGFYSAPDHVNFYEEDSLNSKLFDFGFHSVKSFCTPFVSNYLNKNLSAYCIFVVYRKSES